MVLRRREPELPRGLLLQRGRGERRRRRALALLALHLHDAVRGAVQALDVLGGVGLGAQVHALLVGRGGELALGHLDQARQERLLRVAVGREPDVDAPVLDRVERQDLALALDDQADGDGLDAAGGQARTDAASTGAARSGSRPAGRARGGPAGRRRASCRSRAARANASRIASFVISVNVTRFALVR